MNTKTKSQQPINRLIAKNCPLCSAVFTTEAGLQLHKDISHGN